MISDSFDNILVPIDKLRLMEENPRRGDVAAVRRSFERFGQQKPIVATKDGTVIAGNHSLMAARELGWTQIAVNFVEMDPQEAKAFALADNRTSDLGSYDEEMLAELLSEVATDPELLNATGYTEEDLDVLIGKSIGESDGDSEFADLYSKVVNRPTYEIVGDEPIISELFNKFKADELRMAIMNADLPADVQEFLLVAAYRHVVFNYGKIAEFYPHQTAEVQQLMEDSALVIIDYEDAIKKGYITLNQEILDLMEQDEEFIDDDE